MFTHVSHTRHVNKILHASESIFSLLRQTSMCIIHMKMKYLCTCIWREYLHKGYQLVENTGRDRSKGVCAEKKHSMHIRSTVSTCLSLHKCKRVSNCTWTRIITSVYLMHSSTTSNSTLVAVGSCRAGIGIADPHVWERKEVCILTSLQACHRRLRVEVIGYRWCECPDSQH